ncbi:MAG: acyl carrier protein [Gammaproteobacteria bacterium]|jgi:acyl carrier protein|nr:acyl carrier protein [Gammaproteobacteria bacterium]
MNKENLNAFKKELAGVLVVPIADLDHQKILRSLPTWDSLAIVSTIAMLEHHFNVEVSGEEIESCQTFGDILALTKHTSS